MRVSYHPQARDEIIEAAQWYQSRRNDLGLAFLVELDRCIRSIESDPMRFACDEEDIRRSALRKFPYDVYFRVLPDTIRVLCVKHHHRDPSYGMSRN